MREVESSTPENEFVELTCGSCNRLTRHEVLAKCESTEEDPNTEAVISEESLITRCAGCETVTFVSNISNSQLLVADPFGAMEPAIASTLYPPRLAGHPVIDSTSDLPDRVRQPYLEVHRALCTNLPILAGLGMRVIVEAVCKERAAKGKNLEERINDLKASGVVTVESAKVLHNLRFMGNTAAHEASPHTSVELVAAMTVIGNLLQNVYIIPSAARKLPIRARTTSSGKTRR